MASGGVVTIEGNAGAKLAVSTTSAQTGAMPGGPVDLSVDVEMFIALGADPTATVAAGYRMLPGATYRMSAQEGHKFAAIVGSSTGNLWVHPVS